MSNINHYRMEEEKYERPQTTTEHDDDYDDPDYIKEDIGGGLPRGTYGDYDLYQMPISGGLPIKMIALDNSKRPFTPPFAQLIKISNTGSVNSSRIINQPSGSSTTNTNRQGNPSLRGGNRQEDLLRDSLDNLDIRSTPKDSSQKGGADDNKKQYVYDSKLRCYYDPETNEYFEPRSSLSIAK